MFKFSIITPSFNQGKFISKCLESVRAQNGSFCVEHIILDNCSTDETASVLDVHMQHPGHVDLKIFIERDSGQSAAINKGLKIASGDVLCWLNTDEYLEPNALQVVKEYFDAHPSVDIAYGNCIFIDSFGNVLKRKREFSFSRGMLLAYGCYISSCATFFRRNIIDEGHFIDERFKVCMDSEWYLRLSERGYAFGNIPLFIARFTWHDNNISTNNEDQRELERKSIVLKYKKITIKDDYWLFLISVVNKYYILVRVLRRTVFGFKVRLVKILEFLKVKSLT